MTPLLTVDHLSVSFGNKRILEDCSLSACKGECIGLIGPNGSGKSTFLNAVRGLIPKTSGTVLVDGKDTSSMAEKELAKKIACMQQDFHTTFAYTARELVLSARYPYLSWWQKESQSDEAIADKWMAFTGTSHLANEPVQTLSGGERQRVMLAKALAQETPVLFLDEPTAALDLLYQEELFSLCQRLSQEGKTILLICHDVLMAARYCSRLILLADHHFIADGTPSDVLTESNVKRAFQLDALIYTDPVSGNLSLASRSKIKPEQRNILLLGNSPDMLPIMRRLYFANYTFQCGLLGENTLTRAAADCYHVPYMKEKDQTSLSTLAARADLVLIYGQQKEPYPVLKDMLCPIYTNQLIPGAVFVEEKELCRKIDEGILFALVSKPRH